MYSLSIKRHLAGWPLVWSLKIILLWQVSVRSAGESLQILLHCKKNQVKFCSELHKKQGLNATALIPGDIPAAFICNPKKHVSPQNIYQDFSFFFIFPRQASHALWSGAQPTVLVVLLFTAAWKERQNMGEWFQMRNRTTGPALIEFSYSRSFLHSLALNYLLYQTNQSIKTFFFPPNK